MRRRTPAIVEVPDWVKADNFRVADWVEPGDFDADPRVAEGWAFSRWFAAASGWLDEHGRGDEVMDLLRDLVKRVP